MGFFQNLMKMRDERDVARLKALDESMQRSADGLIHELVRGELIALSKNFASMMRLNDQNTIHYVARIVADQLTSEYSAEYIASKIQCSVPTWVCISAADEANEAMDKICNAITDYSLGFVSDPVEALEEMVKNGSIRFIKEYCDNLESRY